MTEVFRNEYIPDYVSPPGETLEEVLETRGMSQAELAERTGRPKKTINEIVKGKAGITAETALQFELVLGISASFWMNREQQYRESVARRRENEAFQSQLDWLGRVPYREMANLGWISKRGDKSAQLQEVLMFFGVASPSSWNDLWQGTQTVFRKSYAFRSEPGSVAAWLRKGEIEAFKIRCADFNPTRFKEVLTKVRLMTRILPRNWSSLLVGECSSAGVRVVFVPELPGTRVWGATRWLPQGTPLIQLSLRYKTDDHLWFTFFHEAAHILLHGKREVFLETDSGERNVKEQEADVFAREWLVPEKQYARFRRLSTRSCAAVMRFAYQLNVAPGIVVGRLQHDGVLEQAECNHLKKRVDFVTSRDNE
jgi:HTH-type transcriptional regulator / antitoxin HigA